jgi:hypothetical protein
MNEENVAEAALFPENKYISGIFVAVFDLGVLSDSKHAAKP